MIKVKIEQFFETNATDQSKSLLDELKETDTFERVAEILKPFHNKSVFISLIDNLLNELSEETQERLNLELKLKKIKEEKEIEIL